MRLLDLAEKQRLADVRRHSADRWQAFLADGPSDPLGAIAWLTGVVGTTPTDPTEMSARIDRARDEQFTWRQIADALGEGDTPTAARRVMDRRKFWASQVE